MSASWQRNGYRDRMGRLAEGNEVRRSADVLRELPLADRRRAEDLCRILAGGMAGEALATLSAAIGLTVARLNPPQQQGDMLMLVQHRMEDEWQMQRAERRLPPCDKGLPR